MGLLWFIFLIIAFFVIHMFLVTFVALVILIPICAQGEGVLNGRIVSQGPGEGHSAKGQGNK